MKNLFVGNLNFQTTETDLGELFKTFGQVTRVHIAVDRETGRARGFAFIEMPNDDEAAKAIAGLDGKDLAFESNTAIARRTRSSSSAMRMPIRIAVKCRVKRFARRGLP